MPAPDVSLDDPGSYARLDPDDMYRRVSELPQQIAEAWRLAGDLALPDDYRSVRSVLIAGMGGSAIGGSLLESYGAETVPVPIAVWRSYGVPGYVDEHTLVIAVSYSGNTEETLSAVHAAREKGAKLLVVTTGGKLRELAAEWNIPVLTFTYPAQPRATLGYLFPPLIRIFERLGFLPAQDAAVQEAVAVARQLNEEYGREQPTDRNDAKRLAQDLHGRTGVVYGADYLAAVAHRWKTQINENAKNWAFFEEFSELNHNAIVGYEYPRDAVDHLLVLVLDGSDLQSRIRLRMQVTQELMDQFGVEWRSEKARGNGRLAEMFSLIALGDYTSYYLAILNGADPTEIRPIDHLKDALSRASS